MTGLRYVLYLVDASLPFPNFFPFNRSMDVVFLLVSLFIGNEFTVDDLGMLLVMVAVVILIMGVIYRVAVCRSSQGYPIL